MFNWKSEIVNLVCIKQELAEIDTQKLWPWHLPSVAASEQEIMECSHHLGFDLDPMYADFLRYANGWRGFIQAADLFGTVDLLGNEKMRRAEEALRNLDDSVFEHAGILREELFPFAMSLLDLDLFVMTKPSATQAGIVIWFAGYETQRFDNFQDFFLGMVEYNRLVIDDLRQKARMGNPG